MEHTLQIVVAVSRTLVIESPYTTALLADSGRPASGMIAVTTVLGVKSLVILEAIEEKEEIYTLY